MLEPPDLDQAYLSEDERAQALADFLSTCVELQRWRILAQAGELPVEVKQVLRAAIEPGDEPELMLARWQALFDEELRAVFDTRNRFVHGLRVSDRELRGADWLARELLRIVSPARAG